jgi:hypothetical protein
MAGTPSFTGLGKSGTDSGVFVGFSDGTNAYKLSLYKRDAGVSTLLATEAGTSFSTNACNRIDMQLSGYGGSPVVNVYLNGVLLISYSGALSITGVSNFDQIVAHYISSFAIYISEVIVADEDVRQFIGLRTHGPSAAGTTNTWSNNAYTNVNPTTINDANAEYTNAAAQDAQHNLDDLPSGIFQVRAVKVSARAMHTAGSTATALALGIKNGAGAVGVATPHALATAFATVEDLFAINPVTGVAWGDVTEMNALQVNLRSS